MDHFQSAENIHTFLYKVEELDTDGETVSTMYKTIKVGPEGQSGENVIRGLKVGTTYRVTEIDSAGYEMVSVAPKNEIILSGEEETGKNVVQFTNQCSSDIPTLRSSVIVNEVKRSEGSAWKFVSTDGKGNPIEAVFEHVIKTKKSEEDDADLA